MRTHDTAGKSIFTFEYKLCMPFPCSRKQEEVWLQKEITGGRALTGSGPLPTQALWQSRLCERHVSKARSACLPDLYSFIDNDRANVSSLRCKLDKLLSIVVSSRQGTSGQAAHAGTIAAGDVSELTLP